MAINPFLPLSSFQRRLESRRGPGGEGVAGFGGWRVGSLSLWLAFPLCGNGLSKPLDSGLRLPAAGRNDDGGWITALAGITLVPRQTPQ